MSDILSRDPPEKGIKVQYGNDPFQFAELRFPTGVGPFPLLLVIHGGFWSLAYDLTHIGHLCERMTSLGIVTCSLEYRRVGNRGGGWPGTMLDIANASEFFRTHLGRNSRIDISKAAAIGHSAGGHLAFWLGGKTNIPGGSELYTPGKPWLKGVISLAGVVDLQGAFRLNLGSGAVKRLIGGGPNQYRDRFQEASPIELLPMNVRQFLIHGEEDNIVPISQSENFVQKAREAGDSPSLVPLDSTGHFELIDPESEAWKIVAQTTLDALRQ